MFWGPALGERYDAAADSILKAFNDAYSDDTVGDYRTPTQMEYRQTSNVLPLAYGMVPEEQERVFGNLVNDLESRGRRSSRAHLNLATAASM